MHYKLSFIAYLSFTCILKTEYSNHYPVNKYIGGKFSWEPIKPHIQQQKKSIWIY